MPPVFSYLHRLHSEVRVPQTKRKRTGTDHQPHTVISPSSSSSSSSSSESRVWDGMGWLSTQLHTLFPMPSLLALAGGSVLELGGIETPAPTDLFLLLTPIAFSLCFYRSDALVRRHPSFPGAVTGTLLGTTAAMCFLWCLITDSLPRSLSTAAQLMHLLARPAVLLGFLYQGLLTTTVTALAEQWALRHVSAAQVSIVYALEPIFATLFAVLAAQEQFTVTTVVGGALIIAACVLDSTLSIDSQVKEHSV
jgi:drug/metabolite transporter (DMT)-like permease